jgi:precorrin-4/cobalt-precorrin-4 C11-methyltransferase|uniref:Precorrin-4 C(11)-methyltransferase n=1 Tax=Desulfobacca acetoxidans TaxID=60893 RepID=A0A7C5AMC0_9BACT
MNDLNPVIFLGAGPGDPELITVKGQKALARADLVLYAGSLVPPAVLTWVREGAELVDTAPLTLEDIVSRLIEGHRAGRRVVRLHSGDPGLYSALQEQLELLEKEGVPFQVIPGVTAAAAAAAVLRQELTLPEVSQTVIYTRASGRTPVPPRENLASLAAVGATMIIYLSVHLVEQVAGELASAYGPEAPVVVAYRVSWPEEKIIRGTLRDIAGRVREAGVTRQALIMVGPALAAWEKRLAARSRLYDPGFSHGFRNAAD